MNSVLIGAYQMDSAFGLVLPEYTIPAPEPQTHFVNITGRNGAVDLSNAFGVVRYNSRNWELSFKRFDPVNWHTLASDVMNAIHGKRLDFTFDDDPDYHWTGRFSVTGYTSTEGEGSLDATIVSDPYKMKNTPTVVTGSGDVTLQNGPMPTVPTVTASASTTLTWTTNGQSYTVTIGAGQTTVPQLVLYEGETVVNASNSVTFTYTEGSL